MMVGIEEQIKAVEEEIRTTPYNKATSHHIGRLKAKLARLKEQGQKVSSGGRGSGYGIRKSGHATVVLIGYPSVGKSTLLNALTGAKSEVAEYEFTTLDVVPGVMELKGAKIQLLDVPGLIRGAASGRGRGREVLSVIRVADLIVMLVDPFNVQQLSVLEHELYEVGIRLNTNKPDVHIRRRARGGVSISTTTSVSLDEATIKAVLAEYRIHNADVLIREDITVDELIDVLSGSCTYVRSMTIFNKVDMCSSDHLNSLKAQFPDALFISAQGGEGLAHLRDRVYAELEFIRVFLKPQGGAADTDEPLVVKRGATVRDVCELLHRDFARKFRYGRVWGSSVKYAGQRVGLEHEVADGDVLTVMIER
ncbi:MAG: OBG GTPase family GTP-binding protein [Methermicoccaceae archaeon]